MSAKIDPPDHLLSVVTERDGDVVYIHADRAGLEHLRKSIDDLLEKLANGKPDHDHFHSPDWGGWDLTTSMLSSEKESGCKTVHHVKIYSWGEEWKRKQGL
jgi:immunity protein 32 of polymorphic toxin system